MNYNELADEISEFDEVTSEKIRDYQIDGAQIVLLTKEQLMFFYDDVNQEVIRQYKTEKKIRDVISKQHLILISCKFHPNSSKCLIFIFFQLFVKSEILCKNSS
jgi:hypothetical protein